MTIFNETLKKWAGLAVFPDTKQSRDTLEFLYQVCPDRYKMCLTAPTLATEVLRLREAVELARDTFSRYGDLHAAKPDDAKAQANYNLAEIMRQALKGGDL